MFLFTKHIGLPLQSLYFKLSESGVGIFNAGNRIFIKFELSGVLMNPVIVNFLALIATYES